MKLASRDGPRSRLLTERLLDCKDSLNQLQNEEREG